MKQSNYELLRSIEGVFITYAKVSAVKPSQRELKIMIQVYEEEYKHKVNVFCTPCLIEMIRALSNLMRAHVEELNEQVEEVEPDLFCSNVKKKRRRR